MPSHVKSPGRNKRINSALQNLNARKKSKTETLPTSTSASKETQTLPHKVIKKHVYSQTDDTDIVDLGQALLIREQAKEIRELKKRIQTLTRQRNKWMLKAMKKPMKSKSKNIVMKPLSTLDDILFSVRFDLSTKKRKEMKSYLRQRNIHLFAKNEEVRKYDFIKEIASIFEYKEDKITENNKEKLVCSLVCTDPFRLLVYRILEYKNLPLVNDRLRIAISGDKGRQWTKVCIILLDVPVSASKDNVLVLALYNSKDDHENLHKYCKNLFDIFNSVHDLQINGKTIALEKFALGDMPWLCANFGHAGHSSGYPCLMCYSKKNRLSELAPLRTFPSIIRDYENNQEFNQKHYPLLSVHPKNIVPSCLHIPLGIGGDALKRLEVLASSIDKPNAIKNLMDGCNIFRNPKTKQLNGNDMRKFLTQPTLLQSILEIFDNTEHYDEAGTIIDVCSTLGLLQNFMSIKHFDDEQIVNLEKMIFRFETIYKASTLNFTPKGHWLVFHVPIFVKEHRMWGSATEQGQEAIHGSIDDDLTTYRSQPMEKKLRLTIRNCFLRNIIFDKSVQ